MNAFKRLLIGLDLTVMDETVIHYAAFVARLVQAEHLYFLNVQPSLDLPEELREEFPMFDQPVAERFEADLRAAVARHYPGYETMQDRMSYAVVEGSARKELLRWTHQHHIDLLVMGRKQTRHGSGLVPSQVARKASCAILFVPEQAKPQLRHIVVGCDFSDHAAMAVAEALHLQQRAPERPRLTVQHVYQVPMGYYKTGRTEAQFAAVMRQHADRHMHKFADRHGFDLAQAQVELTYDPDKTSPANLLSEYAHKHQADLLIVAARGHNMLTALFLGSVAEKLIKFDADIPLLIIKRKDRSFDFQEMIEQI